MTEKTERQAKVEVAVSIKMMELLVGLIIDGTPPEISRVIFRAALFAVEEIKENTSVEVCLEQIQPALKQLISDGVAEALEAEAKRKAH